MAFGTPVAGGIGLSNGGTIDATYPTGLTSTTAILLFIGQKPSTANGGTATTPTGWTLVDSITGAGGYGATLGVDTGNTNLFVYRKDVVTGTETGVLTVTLGANDTAWAFMVRVGYAAGNTIGYGSADGQRTTAPTAGTPFGVALTNSAAATNLQSGDLAIWGMCIPTDVTTPAQFSALSITSTGTTFAAAVELNEPDSAGGNDIGGYSGYALATAGTSTVAPTVTVTAAGTVTNVRGPIVLVRLREVAAAAQNLTPSLFTNSNTFFGPTVTQAGPLQTLTQSARFDNTNDFYAATVTQAGPLQTLTAALFTNNNTFHAVTVSPGAVTLSPSLFTNSNSFFAATLIPGAVTLDPARFDNTNTFYAATVTQAGAAQTLTQSARFDNSNTFYAATVVPGAITLTQSSRLDNTNVFYAATVVQTGPAQTITQSARFDNSNAFYAAGITQTGPNQTLTQSTRLDNTNVFYAATVVPPPVTLRPPRLDNANAFFTPAVIPATITLNPPRLDNVTQFYTLSANSVNLVTPSLVTNTNQFYAVTVTRGAITLQPQLLQNSNSFYPVRLIADQKLFPARFDNDNTFYPANALSTYGLTQALRFNNVSSIYPVTVVALPPVLRPPLVANPNAFYSPYILAFPPPYIPPSDTRQNMPAIDETPRTTVEIQTLARTPAPATPETPRQPMPEVSTPRLSMVL
jgi:hypothetical protein